MANSGLLVSDSVDYGREDELFVSGVFCDEFEPHFLIQLCSSLLGGVKSKEMVVL
jgi:hypothetical protein